VAREVGEYLALFAASLEITRRIGPERCSDSAHPPAPAGQRIIDAASELNRVFDEPDYTTPTLERMRELLIELGLDKSDTGEFVVLRQIRGRMVSRPAKKPFALKAAGRDDWDGWVELRTAPVNEVAVMNTGRVIRDVNGDVLAVVEAEDRVALKQFSDHVLREVGCLPYDQGDGDRRKRRPRHRRRPDDRGRLGIGPMRSHIHDRDDKTGEAIYGRDCPEYAVSTEGGEQIWFLPNHFKSKFGGDSDEARAKRESQAIRTAEIYRGLREAGHDSVVVLGDLNDRPDSAVLKPLPTDTDLKDVSDHPSFDTGEFKGRPGERGTGTFGLGNDADKIDYLLLSPALFGRVIASGLFRIGAWPGSRPRRWSVYPELRREVHAASDHHPIWAEIADRS
jgi:endonuclease/exonuclease/phosphatase family metal-dependent hydrolase